MRDKLRSLLDPTLFRFILVGLVNTAVGYGVMFGLYNLAGLHTWGDTGYWISSAANYIVGSVVSFFLNKHFTFRNQEKGVKVVLRAPPPKLGLIRFRRGFLISSGGPRGRLMCLAELFSASAIPLYCPGPVSPQRGSHSAV